MPKDRGLLNLVFEAMESDSSYSEEEDCCSLLAQKLITNIV